MSEHNDASKECKLEHRFLMRVSIWSAVICSAIIGVEAILLSCGNSAAFYLGTAFLLFAEGGVLATTIVQLVPACYASKTGGWLRFTTRLAIYFVIVALTLFLIPWNTVIEGYRESRAKFFATVERPRLHNVVKGVSRHMKPARWVIHRIAEIQK